MLQPGEKETYDGWTQINDSARACASWCSFLAGTISTTPLMISTRKMTKNLKIVCLVIPDPCWRDWARIPFEQQSVKRELTQSTFGRSRPSGSRRGGATVAEWRRCPRQPGTPTRCCSSCAPRCAARSGGRRAALARTSSAHTRKRC